MTYKVVYSVVLLALYYTSIDTSAQSVHPRCYTCGNSTYAESTCDDPLDPLNDAVTIDACPPEQGWTCLKVVARNAAGVWTIRSCHSAASAQNTCNSLGAAVGELVECTICTTDLCNGPAAEDPVTTDATPGDTTADPAGSHGFILTASLVSFLFMVLTHMIH